MLMTTFSSFLKPFPKIFHMAGNLTLGANYSASNLLLVLDRAYAVQPSTCHK